MMPGFPSLRKAPLLSGLEPSTKVSGRASGVRDLVLRLGQMGLAMLAVGNKTVRVARESLFMSTVTCMKVYGAMIRPMAKEYISMSMGPVMRVNGGTTCSMVRAKRPGPIRAVMKGST